MIKLLNHIQQTLISEKTYSSFFKAGMLLFGFTLIGISQPMLILYDKDLDAHRSKFIIETVIDKPINQINCSTIDIQLVVDCKIAQHKIRTFESVSNLFHQVTTILFIFGLTLITLSLILYTIVPFVKSENETKY